MGFSRQEYLSGSPCPPPGDLPNPDMEPTSSVAGGFFTTSATWLLLKSQLKHHLSWVSCTINSVLKYYFSMAFPGGTFQGSSFSVISFCLFILLMGFSRKEYWSGVPFPSLVDHVLSELITVTRPSILGGPNSMAHSFTELGKVVVHVICLFSLLWLCSVTVVQYSYMIRLEATSWIWSIALCIA